MKKNHNPNGILPQREGQEQCKKLYRSVTEHAKRLDDARTCAQKITDLFTPKLNVQRKKFRDYCERLIFSDPQLFGQKGEELLWRKSYYDVISTAKKLKKREYTAEEVCNIESHINAGVGYYHHYIAKLEGDYGVNLTGLIDFVDDGRRGQKRPFEGGEWAKESIHRCLIYLGDLCRYKLDIYPNWDTTLAIRYYLQALCLNCDYGMPHNQMGTLAVAQNRTLDAVYHYMHCLACKNTFEGTENNLQRLFERNSQFLEKLPNAEENLDKSDHIKQMFARFFLLIDVWYFEKTIPHIYNLCHKTYIDLEECLSYYKPIANNESDDNSETSTNLTYLTSDALFKIVTICLLCIAKLQRKHRFNHLSTVVAFTLAVYSQLVQNVVTHVEQAIFSFPLPQKLLKKTKKKKLQLRRRRKSVESDSELSESSSNESLSDDDDDDDDDDDVVVELTSSSSDEEEEGETEKKSNNDKKAQKTKRELVKKLKAMPKNDVLEIVSEQHFLQSIKIINDWLMNEEDVLKSCSKTSKSLLRQIVDLLNLLNIDLNVNTENYKDVGLPEDVLLKGVDMFADVQKTIVWDSVYKSNMSVKEECTIRVQKIIAFGKYLTTVKETGIKYDGEKRLFVCEMDGNEEKLPAITFEELEKQNGDVILNRGDGKDVESRNGQLIKMKHMGQLWLAAEVRALESRVKGKASYSPYLVLDAEALIKHAFIVKHLVNSRKFIIIVPSAVVSALDDLKREKLEARDAIRWLESQFHQGNRFFRAQRAHERAPLPFIKYPKKKDKAAFAYIQIIECCHYFAEQQKGASNLVTLLMGNLQTNNNNNNGEQQPNKEISYVGLAKSAGVQIELITQFYSKWKKAAKGKR